MAQATLGKPRQPPLSRKERPPARPRNTVAEVEVQLGGTAPSALACALLLRRLVQHLLFSTRQIALYWSDLLEYREVRLFPYSPFPLFKLAEAPWLRGRARVEGCR